MSYEGGGPADSSRKKLEVHPACLTSERASEYVLDTCARLKGSLHLGGINISLERAVKFLPSPRGFRLLS